ncbi:MAG: 5-formyltetrahydrofolate cyclo-ligase [Chlamydiia bacterium]|nr:5-formyltetrahydrofolate cyclo-ligase [Chlamydiia bacterium]
MKCKSDIRRLFIEKRRALSLKRREEAKALAFKELSEKLAKFPYVLSFASKSDEIDLSPLNGQLSKERSLLLLRLISTSELIPFVVSDIKTQLTVHPKWHVQEPNPDICVKVPLDQVGCVLVPGVAFDAHFNRLGYGKGHYDRFLAKLSCPFFGVGFKEQLSVDPLPKEEHDITLTNVFLY